MPGLDGPPGLGVAPEQVTEYPNPMELSEELQDQLGDVSRW
ncbi:hypothetical protein [Streptomyces sirii]